jgi:hypothetical protein
MPELSRDAHQTVRPYLQAMFVSYVVRLEPNELERGRIAGEVEGVASGRRFSIASLDQLVAFMIRSAISEQRLARLSIDALEGDIDELP